MLFSYELKKIWRRVSPLLVLIVLAATTVATIILTLICFNQAPAERINVSTQYAAMQTKIENWNTVDRASFANTFDQFYQDYKAMNARTLYDTEQLVSKYQQAKNSFDDFYIFYYNNPTYDIEHNVNDYLLVRTEYFNAFKDLISQLKFFFDEDYTNNDDITNGLKFTNSSWHNANLQNIIEDLFFVQEIKSADLAELKNIFISYPANQPNYDYTDAYDYVRNRFNIAIATTSNYTGNLSDYNGFADYQDVVTSTRACNLAQYRLEHSSEDFADPFAFGKIFNNSQQISLLDFVFTNLEMAMIPLVLLVMVWAACTFFTDHNQNTLITPITAGKKRSTIIITKTSVVLLLTVLALLSLTAIYTICGLLFFHAYLSPDILFLFNGTNVMTVSALNYFTIYFLNLIFKLLPLIAICGLFSFVKNKPFIIVGITFLICTTVVVANALLGQFDFYQFIPLMGLDPIRYFGAKLLFAPMPNSYNLWYTFPVMSIITLTLYCSLIHVFRRHDF